MIRYYRRHLDDRQVQQRWFDPRLRSLRVADIRAYLLKKNWKPVQPDRPNVFVFQEPDTKDGEALYQWLPESEQQRDYAQQVYELLAAIAEVEDRYAGDVLGDILGQTTTSLEARGASVARSTNGE